MPDITLHCMAEGRGADWFAVCVDLDIAVQGRSFAEVREGLEQAVAMYLDRVRELPATEQRRLLRRRSPWHLRARFLAIWLLSKLLRQDVHRRPFTLPAHAPA